MSKRVRVTLLQGWSDCSHENQDGPPTYLRDTSEVPGPLQVSHAWYRSGEIPNPSFDDLIDLAKGAGESLGATEVIQTDAGECAFGRFGTAVFRTNEFPRAQAWYLSNGCDFIIVTHISPEKPNSKEIEEVQEIVRNLTAVEKPWWRFW